MNGKIWLDIECESLPADDSHAVLSLIYLSKMYMDLGVSAAVLINGAT